MIAVMIVLIAVDMDLTKTIVAVMMVLTVIMINSVCLLIQDYQDVSS
jgi:hypothetical protein